MHPSVFLTNPIVSSSLNDGGLSQLSSEEKVLSQVGNLSSEENVLSHVEENEIVYDLSDSRAEASTIVQGYYFIISEKPFMSTLSNVGFVDSCCLYCRPSV